MVDADEKTAVDYAKIEKKKLPKDLQNKSDKELKEYVKKQAKKRKEIQQKIQELNTKRSNYIAKQQKGDKNNELDNVMIKAIKRQAKLKNYSW